MVTFVVEAINSDYRELAVELQIRRSELLGTAQMWLTQDEYLIVEREFAAREVELSTTWTKVFDIDLGIGIEALKDYSQGRIYQWACIAALKDIEVIVDV